MSFTGWNKALITFFNNLEGCFYPHLSELEIDFEVPLTNVSVHEKKQAKFECVINKEVTKVMWFRSSEIITSSTKFEIIDDGYKHMLVVNQCEFEDEDTYTIEVMGKRSTATLVVEGEFFDGLSVGTYFILYGLKVKKDGTLYVKNIRFVLVYLTFM